METQVANTRNVWFRSDLQHIMVALIATSQASPNEEWRAGYMAGLVMLATAIGIDARGLLIERRDGEPCPR